MEISCGNPRGKASCSSSLYLLEDYLQEEIDLGVCNSGLHSKWRTYSTRWLTQDNSLESLILESLLQEAKTRSTLVIKTPVCSGGVVDVRLNMDPC